MMVAGGAVLARYIGSNQDLIIHDVGHVKPGDFVTYPDETRVIQLAGRPDFILHGEDEDEDARWDEYFRLIADAEVAATDEVAPDADEVVDEKPVEEKTSRRRGHRDEDMSPDVDSTEDSVGDTSTAE
jgi:hypothetical protein